MEGPSSIRLGVNESVSVAFPKPLPLPVHPISPVSEHQQDLSMADELREPSPPTLSDPPPPYPSHTHGRRSRTGTTRSARRLGQGPSGNEAITIDTETPSPTEDGSENTPLLSATSRRRPRTISHSTMTSNYSLTQTVLSLFQADPEQDGVIEFIEGSSTSSTPMTSRTRRIRRYFRALWKGTYYWPLLHLLLINFPYALIAFVYLFVGTLTGTTLLIALPLGAVICWFNLIGARAFARGEIALQRIFHSPISIQPPNPPNPIFSRSYPLRGDELPGLLESGQANGQVQPSNEPSFLRNTYAMFTDPTSYQALFYFLVIKPSITLFLTVALLVVVPISFALIIPAPAVLRAVKRIGVWQANIALEGLCRPRL